MNTRLPRFARLFWVLANLILGITPSLLFFAWVERNCSLPWIPLALGWPWLWLTQLNLPVIAAWNVALVLIFGLIHSVMAQPAANQWVLRFLPPQAVRTVFLLATGLPLLAVMGLWQNTGVVLWALPLSQTTSYVVSGLIFYGLLLLAFSLVHTLSLPAFLGFKQIYQTDAEMNRTEGTPALIARGIYGHVRHPIYTFTLLAFLVAPTMSLDRMLVFLASMAYLAIGIPIEERKLIRQFGQAYEAYRSRVPAIIPRLRKR